jgi:kynurenine formamidase
LKLIDLSHTIEPDMPRFSDRAPRPSIAPWMSHAQASESGHYENCSCEVTEVSFVTSLSTYLDSPYHFHPGAPSIESIRLEQVVLPGVVVDCTDAAANEPIKVEALEKVDVAGRAVLFHTGWDRYWGEPAYHNHPFLTEQVAVALRERGARLAGVDFLVIDNTADPRRPVHVTLLGSGILIVENLTNLVALPTQGFTFHAAPVKVKGAAAFPVRAYAVVGG